MNFEGPQTHQDTLYEGQGIDPEVAAAFAQAEEGMEPIPHMIEVENIDALAEELGISLEALEQYRSTNSGE